MVLWILLGSQRACCPLLPLRQPKEAVKLAGWRPGGPLNAGPRQEAAACAPTPTPPPWQLGTGPVAPQREKPLLSRSARGVEIFSSSNSRSPSRSLGMWNPRTNTIIIIAIRFHILESSDLQKSRYPVPGISGRALPRASLE